ncbi:MAG TPA: hypothetical protein VGK04_08370 [Thermoanaerobaculia bacterium]|jgi:hypothetical protein
MHQTRPRGILGFSALLLFTITFPAAAQFCGDQICQAGENCPSDCGNDFCGDGICSPELGENEFSCYTDCRPYCGDGVCNGGESSTTCPGDCPPPPTCPSTTCPDCARPSANDSDGDGLPDSLEYDLAHHFFPAILLQRTDEDLFSSYACVERSLPYRARPINAGVCDEDRECIEIRYGIPYRRDYGDQGFPGHLGDSEFYAIVLMRNTSWDTASSNVSSWQMIRDFCAAHWGDFYTDSSRMAAFGFCATGCGAYNDDASGCRSRPECGFTPGICSGSSSGLYPCSSYSDEGGCYFAGCTWRASSCDAVAGCLSATPVSTYQTRYASEKKHALYHSDYLCDSGNWGFDECPYNQYNMRDHKEGKLQNIGEDGQLGVFSRWIRHPDGTRDYDVWGTEKFGESTPYRQHFTAGFFWGLPNPGGAGSNPFTYSRNRDEYLACWGIAGRISSNCNDISDYNDKQMCFALSTGSQSPCTTMTDRNLQLACYGMSVAPNYPSNCRDISDASMRDFCYSVSSWGTWANCSGVSNAQERALCQALTYRNSSYCASITNANDRWFCYGAASHTNSYCGNIVQ